ncbi:MBL fold metallo-hydrolase [Desulfosarcina ovata subsp. sediminis]|uniref:MBL fold metallo-hydrolase n=1 Tax=Desulfosarcina ovata subsp. sediminis TaxID=885957 RepID=A0A5K7ZXR0_9BACT|nr:MBL fold metallo-hydrolase [Desulfosarcina ovata]BBO85065.1 MBL fold metallo-hydrolase [Desulfosarcina ovata subsp. sediminis]
MEEIRPNWYRIEIPLPRTPLKYLNSYVITSREKNLIIDTGLNHVACRKAMREGLRELGVEMDRTDIFITHFHADHFSLVSMLATETTRVFFNRPDAELIESWDGINTMVDFSCRHGFPVAVLKKAFENHPGTKFGTEWTPDLKILVDGQTITYGDYTFTCVATPGHTLGHMCLYEAAEKILVAGDHLLIDITPNIQGWLDQANLLKHYLESLRKVYALDVDLVLPGHRRLFNDHRGRIDELLAHHDQRLAEVRRILSDGPMSAYETASKMTWDIRADNWAAFPPAQQWFATGEALAHLSYLEGEGQARREVNDGKTVFHRVGAP